MNEEGEEDLFLRVEQRGKKQVFSPNHRPKYASMGQGRGWKNGLGRYVSTQLNAPELTQQHRTKAHNLHGQSGHQRSLQT